MKVLQGCLPPPDQIWWQAGAAEEKKKKEKKKRKKKPRPKTLGIRPTDGMPNYEKHLH